MKAGIGANGACRPTIATDFINIAEKRDRQGDRSRTAEPLLASWARLPSGAWLVERGEERPERSGEPG